MSDPDVASANAWLAYGVPEFLRDYIWQERDHRWWFNYLAIRVRTSVHGTIMPFLIAAIVAISCLAGRAALRQKPDAILPAKADLEAPIARPNFVQDGATMPTARNAGSWTWK